MKKCCMRHIINTTHFVCVLRLFHKFCVESFPFFWNLKSLGSDVFLPMFFLQIFHLTYPLVFLFSPLSSILQINIFRSRTWSRKCTGRWFFGVYFFWRDLEHTYSMEQLHRIQCIHTRLRHFPDIHVFVSFPPNIAFPSLAVLKVKTAKMLKVSKMHISWRTQIWPKSYWALKFWYQNCVT